MFASVYNTRTDAALVKQPELIRPGSASVRRRAPCWAVGSGHPVRGGAPSAVSPAAACRAPDCALEAQSEGVLRGSRRAIAAGVMLSPIGALLNLVEAPEAHAKARAPVDRIGEPGTWNQYNSDQSTAGLPYTLQWPGGWALNKLTETAREYGVDFSCYNPDDPAQQLAVFIKAVPGQRSVEDQGSLQAVAEKFATAAAGQKNIGQRKRTIQLKGRKATVYEVETEVGGGTAGRFGSAVESLGIVVVDEIEYTVRATSNGQSWPTTRGPLREAVRSFMFTN